LLNSSSSRSISEQDVPQGLLLFVQTFAKKTCKICLICMEKQIELHFFAIFVDSANNI